MAAAAIANAWALASSTTVGASAVGAALTALLWPTSRTLDFENKHVVITGGSKGLGRAVAQYVVEHGASVSILARDVAVLNKAKAELDHMCTFDGQKVEVYSVDIVNQDAVVKTLRQATASLGPPSFVFTCAGFALPGMFLDVTPDVFRRQMDVNYLGTVYTVHEAANIMRNNGIKGDIVLVSSVAALIAFAGYSAYCPSKFALRGLAEALRNELAPHGIRISMFYPPTMDTEGLKEENKLKPAITAELEGTSDVLSAEEATKALFKGLQKGEFAITSEFNGYMLRVIGNGVSPRSNTLFEVLIAPVLVIVSTIIQIYFDYLVAKDYSKSKESKKSK